MFALRIIFALIFAIATLPFSTYAQGTLAERWRVIAADASGRVGAGALLLESRENATLNGSSHFPMQSVYKLPISMVVLHKVDQDLLSLDQIVNVQPAEYVPNNKHSPLRDQSPKGTRKTIRELIQYALVDSDGTASDVLLKLAGGPQAVTRYVRSLGINGLVVANSEKDMTWQTQYDDWCTPEAALQLLVALEKGKSMSAGSRALILQDMQASTTGANRIRRFLPSNIVIADKTGSSGMSNGRAAATNDIGLVTLPDGRHLALAIFVADSKASDHTREDVIARIARAAWDQWVRTK
jgi:beta-lactamase class A